MVAYSVYSHQLGRRLSYSWMPSKTCGRIGSSAGGFGFIASGGRGGGEGQILEVFDLPRFHPQGAPDKQQVNRGGCDEGHERVNGGGVFENESAKHGGRVTE